MQTDNKTVIIIGFGMAGQQYYQQLRALSPTTPIVVYSDEPHLPYNRLSLNGLFFNQEVHNQHFIDAIKNDAFTIFYFGVRVEKIEKTLHYIEDSNGKCIYYDKLVIATGSSPDIPVSTRAEFDGIFTYRNFSDAQKLAARMTRARDLVIYGSGLVGIKAAYALRKYNTNVTLITEDEAILSKYIDFEMSKRIIDRLEAHGITVKLGTKIDKTAGERSIQTVHTSHGETLVCDTLILAYNIKANTQVAQDASLQVVKGIVVNDFMQTSHEDIYAIGECAEYSHRIHRDPTNIVKQASVAATHTLFPEKESPYTPTTETTKMTILDLPIVSYNSKHYHNQELIYKDETKGLYRKLLLHNNNLVGAVGMGEWHERTLLEQEIDVHATLSLTQRLSFNETGSIYYTSDITQKAS